MLQIRLCIPRLQQLKYCPWWFRQAGDAINSGTYQTCCFSANSTNKRNLTSVSKSMPTTPRRENRLVNLFSSCVSAPQTKPSKNPADGTLDANGKFPKSSCAISCKLPKRNARCGFKLRLRFSDFISRVWKLLTLAHPRISKFDRNFECISNNEQSVSDPRKTGTSFGGHPSPRSSPCENLAAGEIASCDCCIQSVQTGTLDNIGCQPSIVGSVPSIAGSRPSIAGSVPGTLDGSSGYGSLHQECEGERKVVQNKIFLRLNQNEGLEDLVLTARLHENLKQMRLRLRKTK